MLLFPRSADSGFIVSLVAQTEENTLTHIERGPDSETLRVSEVQDFIGDLDDGMPAPWEVDGLSDADYYDNWFDDDVDELPEPPPKDRYADCDGWSDDPFGDFYGEDGPYYGIDAAEEEAWFLSLVFRRERQMARRRKRPRDNEDRESYRYGRKRPRLKGRVSLRTLPPALAA
jgi:hypothetical protein